MPEQFALETRLGPTLRRWRRLNTIKQAALAEDLGVSQSTMSRWESGTLQPDARQARRVISLLTARPSASADRALLQLVTNAAEPVHLICDMTHQLLAASPERAKSWYHALDRLMDKSLWPFASRGIVAGEAALGEAGWYDPLAPDVSVETERMENADLTIEAGEIIWTRMPLSDGSFARLVRDGRRA